jgi:BASS family bile acid:Na+ symporter
VDVLLTLTSVTVFSLMLTIGVNQSLENLLTLWRQPAELARALVAVVVLVPLAVLVLLLVFDLPTGIASGFVLLAASPGAPLTTKRSKAAGAELAYVSSVQLAMALLAVIVTPLILGVFYAIFELDIERISPFSVARQIAFVTFLPVIIGIFLRRFAPDFANGISRPLNRFADALFLVLVAAIVIALAVAPDLRSSLLIGWPAVFAILLMAMFALGTGHFLGGPGRDRRAGLAVVCLARNIGLALFIAQAADSANVITPTLLAYMLLGSAVAIPYSIWSKKTGQDPAHGS